ncbi:upf0414 transmembrane protein c20orf30-like, partial [Lynx pardinus]
GQLRTTPAVMLPTRTNVAAGIPSSKVKYSKLSSTDTGHINRQKETSPTEASFKSKRCPVRSHLVKFKKNSTRIPYKAIACATAQFLIGTFLVVTGCLLLVGYISKVGANRAVAVLIVGILVFLPGFYHLLIAYRAHRGCQGCSYSDLPDCDD